VLYADYNQLGAHDALPPSLFSLPCLHALSLTHNALLLLPSAVRLATRLDSLYLSYNGLTVLPEHIGGMVSLRELTLTHNALTELPNAFVTLGKLESVLLSGNELVRLPRRLGDLSALRELHVDHNQLEALPTSTARLKSLKSLHVQHNAIDFLPGGLHHLAHLTSMRVEGNCFKRRRNSSARGSITAETLNLKPVDRQKSAVNLNKGRSVAGDAAFKKDLMLAQRMATSDSGESSASPSWRSAEPRASFAPSRSEADGKTPKRVCSAPSLSRMGSSSRLSGMLRLTPRSPSQYIPCSAHGSRRARPPSTFRARCTLGMPRLTPRSPSQFRARCTLTARALRVCVCV
jgi:hypothetical protein